MACMYKGERRNTGSPMGRLGGVPSEPGTREGRPGSDGVAERAVVARSRGNARGAKGPWSVTGAGSSARGGD